MGAFLSSILIDKYEIDSIVVKMAHDIEDYYAKKYSESGTQKKVIIVCNLDGAFRFCSDLLKYFQSGFIERVSFDRIKSYNGTVKDPILLSTDLDLILEAREGSNVLLVEDIVDSGKTIECFSKRMDDRGINDWEVATLLMRENSPAEAQVRFVGKTISEEEGFVVGYGMDYKGFYRELNDIHHFFNQEGITIHE